MPGVVTVPLPANLPEDWITGQTVAPTGAEVGLDEQYGYNYLMQQVNNAQTAANELDEGLGAANDSINQLEEDLSNLEQNAGSFILMKQSVPPSQRKPKTLYGLILQTYGGES